MAKTVLALFVELNGIVRFRLSRALEQEGFVVIWAGDIKEAVKISKVRHFDLLLLDLNQPPKADGDLLLKGVDPTVPMLLITEQGADFNPSSVGRTGAVLQKPFRLEALVRTMRVLIDQPGHFPPQMIAGLPLRAVA